jgi:serine/threonine-protein kinase
LPERFLGRTLGKYRIDQLLGTGGFAWVYRAFDPDLQIEVALKVLKPQFAGDPDFEERFRREASTAARLRHPNVITIYAVGREQDAVYFAMDYLPQSLAGRLGLMSTLPGAMLVRLGLDVASALGFAHRQGVIHRDVKPDNVLFDEHGNAIVADFGIARAVAAHAAETGTALVVGTPHYFAPEQARGRPLDGRADLYALGVTLYRSAAGVLPFPGDDWFEVARQHVDVEPADVRTHNPALSADLARVIHRCLEKDPADRFPTAEALHEALAAVPERGDSSSGGRTVAVPALDRIWTSTGMTARRRRLRRRVFVGTAVATAAAAGAIAVARLDLTPASAADAVGAPPAADSLPLAPSAPDSVPLLADTAVVVAAPPADSVVDSAPPAPVPARAALTVVARGAQLSVDGRPMGSEQWSRRDLAPGRYVVRAEIAGADDCPTAVEQQLVVLEGGEDRTVRLSPVGCGQLAFNVLVNERPIGPERGARFVVRGARATRDGDLPAGAPLTLPAGEYHVTVSAPLCAGFDGPVTVNVGAQTPLRIPLICP